MRIAVLSDIHSNLVALEAVLAHLGTVDAVWHLGDVVGYGPEPDAVVERLASIGAIGVRGNHDAAAAGGDEIDYFNPEARSAMEWTRRRITATTRDWLAALPERRVELEVEMVHGSPRDPIWEYVTSLAVARAGIAVMSTTLGLHGHTHMPIAFAETDSRLEVMAPSDGTTLELEDRVALVNPGSVGQPRDGDARASYLVLDPERRSIAWHRVGYDIDAVVSAMHAAGLPDRLAERLHHGV
jgi:predicted phosphodiesterase